MIDLRRRAGARLTELLRNPHSILFLSSGGSALNILDYVDPEVLDSRHTIGVLDERWDADPKINNFAQLLESSFGRNARERGCLFIDTRPQAGESLEKSAVRFENELRIWRSKNPTGQVIITQGIGVDGHTAGILPFPENAELFERLFNDSKYWIRGYDAGSKNIHPLRLTTTLTFLRDVVDRSLVYIESEDKKTILEKALNSGSNSTAEIPGRIIQEIKTKELFVI